MKKEISMKQAVMVAVGLLIAVAGAVRADTCTWTGSWNTTPSGASDVIVVSSGGNLTWDATLPATVASWTQDATYAGTVTVATVYGPSGFTNFTVTGDVTLNGGTWTHLANSGGETNRLCVTVGGNLFITNATIRANGMGYAATKGPGGSTSTAAGGTHGGYGAPKYDDSGPLWGNYASRVVYGSVMSPTNLGSGGGTSSGGAGGGAILLTVAGTSTIYGAITAKGASPIAGRHGGGAGGSVFLTTGRLVGNGSISADGGDGVISQTSSGSGGRVAVILTGVGSDFSQWSGANSAYGGIGNPVTFTAAAGTVYRKPQAGVDSLIIDNGLRAVPYIQSCTPMPSPISMSTYSNVTIRNYGALGVTTNTTLDFSTASLTATNAFIVIMSDTNVTYPATWTINNGYTVVGDGISKTLGNLTIGTQGGLTHSANQRAESYKLNLNIAGNLTVNTNALINAGALGFASGYGLGKGSGRAGGTYGGIGARYISGTTTNLPSLNTYGSIFAPTNIGSGGGRGAAGGCVILTVAGTSTVYGAIKADADYASNGGSGGSLYIRTGSLIGNGVLTVAGGRGVGDVSAGGGGRMSVVLTNAGSTFAGWTGTQLANGGANAGLGNAGAGTVYFEDGIVGSNKGAITVGNASNAPNFSYTAIPAYSGTPESIANASLLVEKTARVNVVTNTTILSLTINTNSYLELAGSTLTVTNLTITNRVFSVGAYGAADLGALVSDSSGNLGKVIVGYELAAVNPQIASDNPTNITTSSAYMNGTLTTNGSSAATVRLYWGPSDGANNPSAWANTNTFAGTFSTGSALTTNITGLNPNTLYYYRYYATNGQGEAWASATIKFINGGVGIQKTSDASEIGLTPGTFTVYRASSATNAALTLTYARTGISATSGVDYAALPMTVTIQAGATNAPITVTPLANWANMNDTTLELTLVSGSPTCIFEATASNATLTVANQPLPYNAPTNVWVAAADGNASVAGNWSLNHVPTSSETVLLGVYSTKNMTWDSAANNTVAKWVQEAGYTGTGTIATTYSAPFTNLTVLGDVTLNGGMWTHLPNTTTETNRLCVTVGGNLFLTNATIHADGMGYGTGGPGAGVDRAGGTYGGLGADYITTGAGAVTNYASRNTYGSIFAPTHLGSCGGRGTPGGAVMLTVAGTSTVSGVISANAGPQSQSQSGCSGGSVFLTTGWLIGSSNSTIRANGGPGTGDISAGGGGRVAIILTGTGADFGNWTGANTAYGWSHSTPIQRSAAGTVYLAAGGIAAGGGTVIVDNNNCTTNTPYTALPAFKSSVENLTQTPWIAQNRGKISVVTNAAIWSLTMNTNSYLDLAGSTLTLKALTITNQVFSAGTYSAAQLGGLVSDSSGSSGQVVVTGIAPRGTVIMIR